MIGPLCAKDGSDPDYWLLTATDQQHRLAIEVCGDCPDRRECRQMAERDRHAEGIWGGKLFGRKQDPNAGECGTYSGAKRHQNEGTQPCLPCIEARRQYGRKYYQDHYRRTG